jgi:hypothetical protein
MFVTGGEVKDPGDPVKKPGVTTYSSAFDKDDKVFDLKVAMI